MSQQPEEPLHAQLLDEIQLSDQLQGKHRRKESGQPLLKEHQRPELEKQNPE